MISMIMWLQCQYGHVDNTVTFLQKVNDHVAIN